MADRSNQTLAKKIISMNAVRSTCTSDTTSTSLCIQTRNLAGFVHRLTSGDL